MSLISFHAQGSLLIPIDNGLPLCSLRAREEAEAWVQSQNVAGAQVVVIGLGGGYHVIEWLNKNPGSRALVIDSRPALLRPFQAKLGVLADRVEVVIVDSVEGLSHHDVMKEIVSEMPPVLFFQPAVGSQEKLFRRLFALCTGRSVEGLRHYMTALGFPVENQIEVSDDGRFLTIKDLAVIIDTNHADHPRAPLVRVLRELVA